MIRYPLHECVDRPNLPCPACAQRTLTIHSIAGKASLVEILEDYVQQVGTDPGRKVRIRTARSMIRELGSELKAQPTRKKRRA